ncbi:c-type cytochrome biogenesis protein CcmI [Basfia succiniciproducens]|uniref:Cytochrome c-type biogenesis protein CcmI n=1 Tax=Basfia succiniciproducens TaxID=653940 RepID=A0A1G5BAS5_9PAST|nr:c-type cytochrome biogenesis protein CcmI [Basfia succiniciproducens]QIM68061.1 c-type cytochrome biogenesis protein CcmI [Basfia succiniciproducens]SCX87227.1 cytochrome c-type biogenesis protein CcmI [Basfia succiniciproducens]
MTFWISALVFTLIMTFICFYPLLRGQTDREQETNRDSLNKAFYFDRLKEIEEDEKQGLLDNAAQLKTELQQSLLEDIPEGVTEKTDKKAYSKLWFVSAFLFLGIIAGVSYFKVGGWQSQEMMAKSYEKLPYFYERLQEEDTKPLDDTELQQFATALRIKLQKEPNDADGWWLLGQLGTAMGNGELAHNGYSKAAELKPDNTDYKLAYARTLMFSDDKADRAKGNELLKEVIRSDHSNLQALSLLAFNYFEEEDYKMAAVTWAMMLRLLPEDDPKRALIEKSIRSARDALAEQEQEKHNQMIPQNK